MGQSAGDPFRDEDDIPIVLRSWHAQRFLVTALHVKGHASSINVLGIMEVQVCSCFLDLLNFLKYIHKILVKKELHFILFLIIFWWPSLVQELLSGGSYNEPKTVHDIIALLATRLSRWDDR